MDPYEFATTKAVEAGELLLRQASKGFEISSKGGDPKDVVTSIDQEISEFLIAAVQKEFPAHAIYSEEGGGTEGQNEYRWTIDPIDGSANFSRGIPHYAVVIGLLHHNEPLVGAVYNPVTRELFSFKQGGGAFFNGNPMQVSAVTELSAAHVFFHAGRKESVRDWGGESYRRLLGSVRKTSNLASSSLDACFVAAGRIEANVYGTLSTLDIAAALGILKEAGGVISDAQGLPLELSKEPQRIYMANNPAMLQAVRTLLQS